MMYLHHTHDVAMGFLGMSWGVLIGGEVTDFMLILNTQQAVDSFKSNKQVSLGAEMSLAIGPLGRTGAGNMTAHAKGLASIYSYSHSRGLFAGISLEGAVLSARQDGALHISLSLLKKSRSFVYVALSPSFCGLCVLIFLPTVTIFSCLLQ